MSDVMYVCTACGSPSLEYSVLVGGRANCKACKWEGLKEELAAIPVRQGGLLDGQQTLTAMYNDFRKIFSASAKEFAQFLVKWGFVDATQTNGRITITKPEHVVIYINGMFLGAFKNVIETRERIEKERVNGS